MSNLQVFVLAAGASRRLGLGQSKLTVPVCGRPLLTHVLHAIKHGSQLLGHEIATTVITGYQSESIRKVIHENKMLRDIDFVEQAEQKGTGHALLCAQEKFSRDLILVLNGDMPLITGDIIKDLVEEHRENNNTVTLCAAYEDDPSGYGRVFISSDGISVKEHIECSDTERSVKLVNAGVYLFSRDFLEQELSRLTPSSATGEVYITQLIERASLRGKKSGVLTIDAQFSHGVNTLAELASAEKRLYQQINSRWLSRGVRIIDPDSVLIDPMVEIGVGTVIERGVCLRGHTIVGKNCTVGAYSLVNNTILRDNSTVLSHCVITDSDIGNCAAVGPFARLRDQVTLGQSAVVGNFVEVKKSTLGATVKAKHLSYLGDATIGEKTNIGAGCVTCNYDGKKKHQTVIEDNVMVGANSSLVAPLVIEKESYIAAGSVINKDVPAGALAIERTRQENKTNWHKRAQQPQTDRKE